MTETLRASGLSRSYGGAAALAPLDFDLAPGERLALLGASGSGKTTLLRLLTGLEAPSAGELRCGEALWSGPGRIRVAPEDRRSALVFQGLALWPRMSVEAQLRFVAPGSREAGRALARRLAQAFGLGARLDAQPRELSGGEKQRLALARGLAQEPARLYLDEPLAQLEGPLRRAILDDLLTWLDERPQTSAVFVSHQLPEAGLFGDRVLVLEAGHKRFDGRYAEAREDPRSAAVARVLDLGALLPATDIDDERAQTPLGSVNVRYHEAPLKGWVLIRPGDLRLRPDEGGEARVVGLEGGAGGEFEVLIKVGEALLRGRSEAPLARGARVTWELRGRCWLLPEE